MLGGSASADRAFEVSKMGTTVNVGTGSGSSTLVNIDFAASRSSSLNGKSTTIQTNALRVLAIIKS